MDPTRIVIMGAAGRDFHDFNVVYPRRPDASRSSPSPRPRSRASPAARYPAELAGPLYPDGHPDRAPRAELERLIRDEQRRPGRLRLQRRRPRDRDARRLARRWPRAPTSCCSGPAGRCSAARRPGHRRRRRPHRRRARARRRATSPRCSTSAGLDAGRHPPPDALRRPRRAARPALRDVRRPRPLRDARSRSARSTSRTSTPGRVVYAGRRLRGDPAPGRDRGRRHPLGRRQQRLPVLPAGPATSSSPTRSGPATSAATTRARPTSGWPTSSSSTRSTRPTPAERRRRARPRSRELNPRAPVVDGPLRPDPRRRRRSTGKRVVVVEDGPTLTHGGMTYGAGVVAARRFGAGRARRPAPVRGRLASRDVLDRYPRARAAPPGDGLRRRRRSHELEATLNAVPTPTSSCRPPRSTSTRVLKLDKPIVRVRYELEEVRGPSLESVLEPIVAAAKAAAVTVA